MARFVRTDVSNPENLILESEVIYQYIWGESPFFVSIPHLPRLQNNKRHNHAMKNFIDAKEIKDQISIVWLLSRLGFQPVKKSGKEHFYLSMLRKSDTMPSFTVNDHLGVWYDHGSGEGGNVIDLCMKLWTPTEFHVVLQRLADLSGISEDIAVRKTLPQFSRPRLPKKVQNYEVQEVKNLGNNYSITKYLKQRGVWEVGFGLKEVYYYVENEKKQRKHFFSAGWQNENGGWEVRNPYFKGCLGRKGLTLIPGFGDHIHIFEGYMDFLSWKFENRGANDSILVLNSIALLEAAIRRTKSYQSISIYFDFDTAGREATKKFLTAVPAATDCSNVYYGYQDYNQKIQAENQVQEKLQEPREPFMAKLKVGFCR